MSRRSRRRGAGPPKQVGQAVPLGARRRLRLAGEIAALVAVGAGLAGLAVVMFGDLTPPSDALAAAALVAALLLLVGLLNALARSLAQSIRDLAGGSARQASTRLRGLWKEHRNYGYNYYAEFSGLGALLIDRRTFDALAGWPEDHPCVVVYSPHTSRVWEVRRAGQPVGQERDDVTPA